MNRLRTATVLMLAVISCDRGVNTPRHSPPPRSIPSVAQFIQANAPRSAADCGTGDGETASEVYACGAAAIAAKRSSFCRYETIVTQTTSRPWHVTAGYIYDSRTASLWVVSRSDTGSVSKQYVIAEGLLPPARFLDRGMRPPVLSSNETAPSPAVKIEGIVIIECEIDATGRVRRPQILKRLPGGIDTAALQLVAGSRFKPAELFGIAVPILHNITVIAKDGTLRVRNPAARS